LPRRLQVEAGKLAVETNAEREAGNEVEAWDCLYIIDYQAIMTQNMDLWKRRFEKRYTPPGDENKPGSWKARSVWIVRLNELRNNIAHGRSITAKEHDFLVTLDTWLIKGQADNDL